MGRQAEQQNKQRMTVRDCIFFATGILLTLTMLSVWFVCGLYAKYVIGDTRSDAARVAKSGVSELELIEHKATLDKGEFHLEDDEVTENSYNEVVPGVDIPKDPFIRFTVNADAEVTYELFMQVIESDPFPNDTVTYEITNVWEVYDAGKGIYKFTGEIEKGKKYEISILKDDRLYVSEHYVGKIKEFSLSFNAWLEQVNSN